MKKFLTALAVIVLANFAMAGETSFHTLPNGMKVILKENHAVPLVSSVVVVKAGSKYETDKNNGFTHLLEHMLFNGTETRSREEFNEAVKDHGGYINAFTRQEMTGYLIVMPTEFIDFGLDIQSDQLFHSTLPAEEFPKERDIVAEEIKKDNDNVENVAQDFFNSVIYKGTPYARPVIGYESTIRNVTRDEVMKYYKEHYVPNNMIAFISGDFETPVMLDLVKKYFGPAKSGKLPKHESIAISPKYGTEIQVKRYPTKTTYLQITLPAPRYTDPDYFAFDILTQMLGSGESSPLAGILTSGENPLATDFSVSLETQEEFSLMNISVRTDKPENIEVIKQAVVTTLKELPRKEVSPKEINRVVVPNKVEEIKLEEKLHYYGIMKAPILANCGYEFLENYIPNLSKVTPADISGVEKKYFTVPQYLAVAMVPSPEVE